MSIMHGKTAKIYWDAADTDTNLLHGQNWGCDGTHDVAEVTSMQSTGNWREYLGGFRDWTATVSCLLPKTSGGTIALGGDDGMGDDECKLELYLLWDSGTPLYIVLYGSAICTGNEYGVDANGAATISYTFQGVAQLTWASDSSEPSYV